MNKTTFCLLLLLAAPTLSIAQLAGTYTVGGANPDFDNFTQLTQQLQFSGVSGPTTFRVRPGTYPAFALGVIPGTSAGRRVTFEPENGDSLSVILKGATVCKGSRWVTFRRLHLTSTGNQKKSVLRLQDTHEIRLENCLVDETGPLNYDYNEGLVYIETFQSPDSVRAYVLRSWLSSATNAVVARGSGSCQFRWNTIRGDWDLWTAEYRVSFQNDDLWFTGADANYAKEIYQSTLHTEKSGLNMFCGRFVGNRVTKPVYRLESATVQGNIFDGDLEISYSNKASIQDNRVGGALTLSYCYDATLVSNALHGPTRISFCDGMEVVNNLVYSDMEITHGANYRVFHNNFGPGIEFTMDYTSGLVRNNNLSNISILNLSLTTLQDNNYFPTKIADYAAYLDPNPRFYDPAYVNASTDLHATNRQLSGKSGYVFFTSTARDFDGKLRSLPATIGANELCYQPGDLPDTVWVSCTEPGLLRWCDPAQATLYFWTTADFTDTLSGNIVLPNDSSRLLFLHGPAGIEDTVFFAVAPFPGTYLSTRTYYLRCGSQVILNTFAPPGAQISWTPATGLNTAVGPVPVATVTDTIAYVAHIQTGHCATLEDSIWLLVDQRPQAYFDIADVSGGVVQFSNLSTCADAYWWDFGDDTQSAEYTPVHQYTKSGVYIITLTAYNNYGTSVYTDFVPVELVDTQNPETETAQVRVAPNPSNGQFTVDLGHFSNLENRLELTDAAGRNWAVQTVSNQKTVDMTLDAPPGCYYLKILNVNGLFYKPIILHTHY